jgi:hypothetical protein
MITEDTHNYGRLVLPDFIPHSGGFSMDNPEYILQVREHPRHLLNPNPRWGGHLLITHF